MRSFKNHFNFVLALFVILFSIEFGILSTNIVKEYEKQMNNDYNIIIVSVKDLSKGLILPIVPNISSLQPLSTDEILKRISKDISEKNLTILKNSLPKFYSIKLNSFPSNSKMQELRIKLLKFGGITKVETFSKTHNKVYKTLVLTKMISYIYMGILLITGILMISKQIKIWMYEHKERIDIMTLFGAPFWLKSAILYKTAIFDSMISTVLVVSTFYILPKADFLSNTFSEIGIYIPDLNLLSDTIMLFITSVSISLILVSVVIKKAK